MKTASILLALVAVLGFAREAGAESYSPNPDYTFKMGNHTFGFLDDWWATATPGHPERHSQMYLGPLSHREVSFTATQGHVASCVILATLVIVPMILIVRWKKWKLRFSIRDLLWLTLLCAVLVAWWMDHRKQQSEMSGQADKFEQRESELIDEIELIIRQTKRPR